ncbi:MAG: hypothetical protein QM778_38425 [Myxococcales bacterium]
MAAFESAPPIFAETQKRPGVFYAVSSDGVELPIIDVTHPAFALSFDDEKQRRMLAAYLREQWLVGLVPAALRRRLYRWLLRDSLLGPGMRLAEGAFLSGMSTYLFKLGPDNLGRAYAKPIDRRVVGSLPGVAMRLRLSDMASLLAEHLGPLLAAQPERPLCLLNIAGGPAMDTLNALLLLHKRDPGLLTGRVVRIALLDMVEAGPLFGARALRALSVSGAPLHGLDIGLEPIPYDWHDTRTLQAVLARTRGEGALVAGSSEGGLFEYGDDRAVQDNLSCLQQETPEEFVMVGSVTRGDASLRRLHALHGVATHPRGLPTFRRLVEPCGFRVIRAIERPFSDHVVLAHAADT